MLSLIVPLALLHVTSTVFANVTFSFEVSVTSELDSELASAKEENLKCLDIHTGPHLLDK